MTLRFFHVLALCFGFTCCSVRPTKLSDKSEVIEVSYINWACNCADFIETKFYILNPKYEAKSEDCIFIEPADSGLRVSESFYIKDHFDKNLKLTGSFYLEKGVPDSYEQAVPGRPEKAKVFRYTKIEIIEK